jgi:cytosine/adenosine deaminase-related metal-dependent hydrolase
MTSGATERTLLLANATVVATMDDGRHEHANGGVFIRGRAVAAVGPMACLPATADEVLDCTDMVVLPGLVNTHHHFFQTLTRALPHAQDAELFGWLRALYPVWGRMTPEMLNISAQVAMAELMLSGCTTASDHLYVYPNGGRLDDTIEAARTMGLRFHACRGAMSVGESQGGLPPDSLVEREERILADTRRVIEAFHDPARFSMLRVAAAPCSPFSVSPDLMRETSALAKAYGVGMHTHLAESDNDVAYSREHFGCTPAQYAERSGWTGPHVWHAHCVKLDADGIDLFARTGTGVAHCPSSNMRLASGIAPVRRMLDAGVNVGLGVDGSASNDSSHLLAEARQALLLQRVGIGPAALSGRAALEIATRGGARVLGRDDIGYLAPGMAADVVAFDLNDVGYAGAGEDPVAALVFCAPTRVAHSVINGRVVIRGGTLRTVEVPKLARTHRALARTLARGD